MTDAKTCLAGMLEHRLDEEARGWLAQSSAEVAEGVAVARFCALISLASRFMPRGALAPEADERTRAETVLAGWNTERWTVLEAARVALVLARSDLAETAAEEALEEAFRYADGGELCALYRSLALLPDPERFLWRAAEGCRTNIRPVFEADTCDTPYPFLYFDDVAWNQLCIKAVFIDAPLWRVFGLDRRLSPELARMALDLADERRSAGRDVQHELWLCLGPHGGERGLASIERELESESRVGRRAAAIALARADAPGRLAELLETERDPEVLSTMRRARDGHTGRAEFRALDQRSA